MQLIDSRVTPTSTPAAPNEDPPSASPNPARKAWLARFGRTAGSEVTGAVSERLAGGLAPGAHATLAGRAVDLSKTDGGDPFARDGLADPLNDPGAATRTRTVTARELLLGSSFHVAGTGGGSGPGLAAWGRVALGRFDGEQASGEGRLRLDGEVLTGTLGADADWGRTLAGVAVSLSGGDGKFGDSGASTGRMESRMTTVSPYARYKLTERVSAWGLAGLGRGEMKIRFDDDTDPVKTDLSMRLGALGARGSLMEQGEAGGMDLGLGLDMDLALKADAFFVRTESEKAENSAPAAANASRMRLALEGGRRYDMGGGRALRPSLELGARHDGGDAETGAGLEAGGGVSYTDPSSGFSVEARARMLAAHADSDYREWGASATARLDPGERGRGLSFSLAPTVGAASSASERLWSARDARGLAPGGGFKAGRGVTGEMGYGLPALGGRFTHTPNVGFGTADGGARDYRMGWRLAPASGGWLEFNLDAARREAANGNGKADHGLMLRSLIRW